ncbi:MAG: isoprenylcysteine carboxylmethyltransferase family protein [Acidobacteriia bacterium]|nr:isoprenylcysteine carboxylmethyltransferase family protein [Terriglobia bacterium]
MRMWLQTIGWLACAVYSTIPAFWFMIHPFAERWRSQRRSPYRVLLPLWIAMWIGMALVTQPWHRITVYQTLWSWAPAIPLFAVGIFLYSRSGKNFTAQQLGGLPEVHGAHRDQRLVTDGIRSRVRHPVYLAHLCEMFAWSLGTGLAACWGLTAFAIVTGTVMIQMEDAELEQRFGEEYRAYRGRTPALLLTLRSAKPQARPRLSADGACIQYEIEGQPRWRIAIRDLVCIAEYTTAAGPRADDYFLVFATKSGLYYEAAVYCDGRDAAIDVLSEALGRTLKLGLIKSAEFASRVLWPPSLEGHPLFMRGKEKVINPEVRQLTAPRQL